MTSLGLTPMTGSAGLATKASNQLCQRSIALIDASQDAVVYAGAEVVAIGLLSRGCEPIVRLSTRPSRARTSLPGTFMQCMVDAVYSSCMEVTQKLCQRTCMALE